MTIEVQYKTAEAYSFHAFSLKELRSEITQAKKGITPSSSEILLFLEKSMKQVEIAKILGVTPRYLRYIKTGKRLSEMSQDKKDKTIRNKLLNLGKKHGLKTGGGYTVGQLRAANYLDFVCQKGDEVAKDVHEIWYEHGAMSITNLNYSGLGKRLQNNMRETILEFCAEGAYCDDLIFYRRGNKHPKKDIFCEFCRSKIIAKDNKRLIYTVIMKK